MIEFKKPWMKVQGFLLDAKGAIAKGCKVRYYPTMSAAEKISITLTPEMNRMIKQRVEQGDFGSTSELIREALRVWQKREEEHQENLKAIRARLQASMDDPRPSVPVEDVFERLKARHEAIVAAEKE